MAGAKKRSRGPEATAANRREFDWFAAAVKRFGHFQSAAEAFRVLRRFGRGWRGQRYLSVYLCDRSTRAGSRWAYTVNVHRLVMAYAVGRQLTPQEQVHHIDGNPRNNHPSNLKILTRAEHAFEHGRHYIRRDRWGRWKYRLPGGSKNYHSLARLVAGVQRGRPLSTREVVVHRNGDWGDIRPENLEVRPKADHMRRKRYGWFSVRGRHDRETAGNERTKL